MRKILFFALLFCINMQAQFTDEINSNRPGKSLGAFSVGKSLFQVEAGTAYVKEKHNNLKYDVAGFNAEFSLRWGILFEQLEFVTDAIYQNDSGTQFNNPLNRSGLRNAVIGAKYLVFDPFKNYVEKKNLYSWKAQQKFNWRQMIPAVSVYAGVNLNFSNNNSFNNTLDTEPIASPKFTAIAQNHFGSRWVLVTNLTYNKIATPFASLDYIFTLTRGFDEHWSGFFEHQGYQGKYYSDGLFRLGAAYLFKKDFQLDASVGYNIKNTPTLLTAGLGLSWRFIDNYKPVKMAKPENQSKMDKKMEKAAEKEKKRKRKDEKIE